MNKAAVIRLAIGLGAAVLGFAWFASAGWSWRGVGGLFAFFVFGSIAAEAAYRRLAAPAHQVADLIDRVRNPD